MRALSGLRARLWQCGFLVSPFDQFVRGRFDVRHDRTKACSCGPSGRARVDSKRFDGKLDCQSNVRRRRPGERRLQTLSVRRINAVEMI